MIKVEYLCMVEVEDGERWELTYGDGVGVLAHNTFNPQYHPEFLNVGWADNNISDVGNILNWAIIPNPIKV